MDTFSKNELMAFFLWFLCGLFIGALLWATPKPDPVRTARDKRVADCITVTFDKCLLQKSSRELKK